MVIIVIIKVNIENTVVIPNKTDYLTKIMYILCDGDIYQKRTENRLKDWPKDYPALCQQFNPYLQ